MGLMKTLSQSSKELKDILDRLTALESGETFVTTQMFNSLNQTVTTINTDVTNIKNGTNIENIMLANYPVGSIYFSIDSANPSTKFGGTWVAWGAGRVPVGVNGTDSDFNAVEKTGGEKKHVLTLSEIPAHSHTMDSAVSTQASIVSTDTGLYQGSGAITFTAIGTVNETDETGQGIEHNNLQPYITCYMWKRTAQKGDLL